jgi:hypothetical protein
MSGNFSPSLINMKVSGKNWHAPVAFVLKFEVCEESGAESEDGEEEG